MTIRRWWVVPAVAACVSAADGQEQGNIPIRHLAIEATSTETFNAPFITAWQWPDGEIIATLRARTGKALVLDKDLKLVRVLADSSLITGSMIAFSSFIALPYWGDTTVVFDPGNSALVVLDREGKQVRVSALPRATDMRNIATGYYGNFFDPQKRLVYRGLSGYVAPPGAAAKPAGPVDSSCVVRADFERRAVDTLISIRVLSAQRTVSTVVDGGTTTRTYQMIPNTWADDWAVLADGSIAVLRAQDYHIDWVYADGTHASTPKMPFDWRRLTGEEKQAKLDTMRAFNERTDRMMDSLTRRPGQPVTSVTKRVYAPLNEIPDYFPSIQGPNRLTPDADNRLWIQPNTSLQARGGLLMDVINKQGVIEERVQLPPDAAIAGFGKNGVVFLRVLGPDKKYVVARARIVP